MSKLLSYIPPITVVSFGLYSFYTIKNCSKSKEFKKIRTLSIFGASTTLLITFFQGKKHSLKEYIPDFLCFAYFASEVLHTHWNTDEEKAKRIVAEWKRKNDPAEPLLLQNLDIETLPPLPDNVEYLYVNNTKIQSLPHLPQTLFYLYAGFTKLTSLPPLPQTLVRLHVCQTKLTSLPPLPPNLRELSASNTPLALLPDLPNSLQWLECSSTNIQIIPALPPNLYFLACSYLEIETLPPLPSTLSFLYCHTCPNLLIESEVGETVQEYEARWKPIREIIEIQRKQREERETLERNTNRCKQIKEMLMEKTWHPDRYLQWCIDEEERIEWLSYKDDHIPTHEKSHRLELRKKESCSNAM